jgi:hypothetical protein
MSTTTTGHPDAVAVTAGGPDVVRLSTRFGVAFAVCQIAVLVMFSIFVLPKGGSPTDPVLERGRHILDAHTFYVVGNYGLALSGMLILGFLGAVAVQLRRADPTGVLAPVAVAAGSLLALIWPLAAVVHDVFLGIADTGADLRILAGADAIAPYSLALSVFPRVFFLGAIVLALRSAGSSPTLQRTGAVIAGLSLLGSGTVVVGALFPLLALATLGFEVWVGALAWHWLRERR